MRAVTIDGGRLVAAELGRRARRLGSDLRSGPLDDRFRAGGRLGKLVLLT